MSLSVRQHLTTGAVALVLGFAAIAPAAAQAKGLNLSLGDQTDRVSGQTDKQSDKTSGRDVRRSDGKTDAERRSDRIDKGHKGDLRILDRVGLSANYVARGHDVVVDQPGNRYTHYWVGNDGRYYMVVRDNNKGWSVGFVMVNGAWVPVPPPTPKPRKRSFISLYDPDTDKTYTRIWPAGGGVINVTEDGDQRDKYDHR